MDDIRVGAAFRAVRLRRRWRQEDVAARAGVSAAFVSLVERGHLERASLATLRRLAAALDIRIDVVARWRGGELDRLLNARHSALHESVASHLLGLGGWLLAPEVTFAIGAERGVIDILAYHEASGCLLVIELKTAIIDVNELLGTLDRKRRLAKRIATERGWQATSVSCLVVVQATRTNERRVAAHQSVLRAALPGDGRTARIWLQNPQGTLSSLAYWKVEAGSCLPGAPFQRVRVKGAADRTAGRAGSTPA